MRARRAASEKRAGQPSRRKVPARARSALPPLANNAMARVAMNLHRPGGRLLQRVKIKKVGSEDVLDLGDPINSRETKLYHANDAYYKVYTRKDTWEKAAEHLRTADYFGVPMPKFKTYTAIDDARKTVYVVEMREVAGGSGFQHSKHTAGPVLATAAAAHEGLEAKIRSGLKAALGAKLADPQGIVTEKGIFFIDIHIGSTDTAVASIIEDFDSKLAKALKRAAVQEKKE